MRLNYGDAVWHDRRPNGEVAGVFDNSLRGRPNALTGTGLVPADRHRETFVTTAFKRVGHKPLNSSQNLLLVGLGCFKPIEQPLGAYFPRIRPHNGMHDSPRHVYLVVWKNLWWVPVPD